MIDNIFQSPRDLFWRIDPQTRWAVRRTAFRYTAWGTAVAVLMCVAAHVVLSAFALLPYPIWPAVFVGSIMAGLFAAMITWRASMYIVSAYHHLEAARDEFEWLSRIDPLTGLLNRRAFVQAFTDTPGVTALALFDIDHFKKVNDRFGHGGGDAALVEASRALQAAFVAPDMVARIGGEEFAVMVASCAGPDAVALIERARQSVGAQDIAFEAHTITVTASAGIAHAQAGDSIDHLLLAADRALYLAKQNGRNRLIDAGGLAVLRAPPERPSVSEQQQQQQHA